jgi:hypothetical protein
MKIIQNKFLPPRGFTAIMLLGMLFTRLRRDQISETTLRHERIHARQMWEMLVVGFYLWYLVEWIVRRLAHDADAYHHVSFEREAYGNQGDAGYLKRRRLFGWVKYLKMG